MLIPLGLALKLRNLPFITILIILVCFGYYFKIQSKEIRIIEKQIKEISEDEALEEMQRKLFVEYCIEADNGLSKKECEYFKKNDEKKKISKNKKKKKIKVDFDFKDVFSKGFKFLGLYTEFIKISEKNPSSLEHLKSYQDFYQLKQQQKQKIHAVHLKYHLLSKNNISFYTIIKAIFSHVNFSHLLGNMFMLFIFGRYVEDRVGHILYLSIYLIAGSLAMFLYGAFLIGDNHFVVGASANVSVIMGMFYVLYFHFHMKFWVWYFASRTFKLNIKFYFFFFYIISEIILTFSALSNVAHAAHALGLIFGMIVAKLIVKSQNLPAHFIHPKELEEWQRIKNSTDVSQIIALSHQLLTYNPYNKTVRNSFFKRILGSNSQKKKFSRELLIYLTNQLGTIGVNAQTQSEKEEFLSILKNFPDRYGMNPIFYKIPQQKILKFIDMAIDYDELFVALRLIIVYVEKYPRSRKNKNLLRTLQSVLENIEDSERLSQQIIAFIDKIRIMKIKYILNPYIIQGEESNA